MSRTSKYNISTTDNENMWNVAIYIRLSVEDGDKVESNSVSNQRMLLNDFLGDNTEFNLYDYYVDDGYSGTDFERPEFKRMLKDMNEKKFNTIIVKDLSRLGRNYIEVGNYIERIFPLFNIRFIAVNDGIDSYKDPKSINNVIVPFKNLLNDEYCRDISNKIRSVLDVKKRRGEYVSALAPYGYIKDPENKHHLIIDEESANVVKMIFKMSLEGYGRYTIAHKLNELGILNPYGYKMIVLKKKKGIKKDDDKCKFAWDMTVIKNILADQTYCGDTVQNKGKLISYKIHKRIKNPKSEWIIVENTHEPIIDRKVFERVQIGILNRDTRIEKNGKISIFAGHLKCGDCKRAMNKKEGSKNNGKPRKHFYYMCSTYMRRSKDLCSKHTIRNDVLEETILRTIKFQIELVADYDKIVKELKKASQIDYRKKVMENNLIKAEQELKIQKKLRKLAYEDWKLEKITEAEYIEYSSSYTSVITLIESNIKKLYEELEEYNEKEEKNDWVENFLEYKNIKELSRQVIDELIDEIYVYEDGRIQIKFRYEEEYKEAIEYVMKMKKLAIYKENVIAI